MNSTLAGPFLKSNWLATPVVRQLRGEVDGVRPAFRLTWIAERSSESSQGIHPLDHEFLNSVAARERRNDSSPQIRLRGYSLKKSPLETG